MTEEKEWYSSTTIWGALIAVAASILGGFGYTIGPESQTELADSIVRLIGALGGIAAIYGRLKATEVIS